MKQIKCSILIQKLVSAIDFALKTVDAKAVEKLKVMQSAETSANASWALNQIVLNAEVAKNTDSYPCQDTGLAVFFVEYGSDICLDGDLTQCINEAVKIGYQNARKSVADPLTRINTGDNTPAIIYTDIVGGQDADKLKISFLAKGAGSENMSKIFMLTPSKGKEGIIESVVNCVKQAGSNPCPPICVGVGIGGDFEKSALLAKKALLRPIGEYSENQEVMQLEKEILHRINCLGIGAAGLKGDATAMSVAIQTFPTHIGMLPVAVNIQCHSVRHTTIVL